jgi:short-subunit dehydrogenase
MSYFQNKVVVVTGGSEGIGLALVEKLLHQGAQVSTCSRKFDKLYSLQLKYTGSPLHTMTCDVSKPADCEQFIAATLNTFGRIDILINNAGISMRAEFKDASVTVLQQLMDVNFWGAVYCTKLALPSLLENKGTVVGISSIAGYRGLPGRSGYSASKHALQGWLEALRTELLDSGVHVMWISPGFTSSNIRNTALDATGKAQGESPLEESELMTASECAAEILKAVAKKKRTLVLSSNGKQTVFLNRLSPSLADRLVHRFFYKNGSLIK